MCRIQRRVAAGRLGHTMVKKSGDNFLLRRASPFNTTWSLDLSDQNCAQGIFIFFFFSFPLLLPIYLWKCRRHLLKSSPPQRLFFFEPKRRIFFPFFGSEFKTRWETDRWAGPGTNKSAAQQAAEISETRAAVAGCTENCVRLASSQTHSETAVWRAASLVRETFH